jgi:hypothetical protein
VRAAAENPKVSTPVGSSLADFTILGLRELAGPFGPAHPWLEEGDWGYAFRAHFDFVVHEKLDGQHPTHPLFAVEFDGARTHVSIESRRRDRGRTVSVLPRVCRWCGSTTPSCIGVSGSRLSSGWRGCGPRTAPRCPAS